MVFSQDILFSQFYLNPLYLNPAYAGTMEVPRVGVQYRNQWPGLDKAFTTYFASFDTYLPKQKIGVGMMIFNDNQNAGLFEQTQFDLMISKGIQVNKEAWLYGSLSAGYRINSLNWNALIFADGLDPNTGATFPSSEVMPENLNKSVPDFAAGLLYFDHKYFAGIAVHHLNEPNLSWYDDDKFPLYRKYTAHLEVNLPLHRSGRLRKFISFNPNVIFQHQGGTSTMTWGLYANRKGFSLGSWFRHSSLDYSDVILMAGFIGKRMKTAITYDINLQGIGFNTGGAVEVSVQYTLKMPGEKSNFPFYEIPGEWDLF